MSGGNVALSIPGLVLTCAQYFVLLQLGRDFESDFGSSYLELQWIDLRIRRWSKAAGITNQNHEDFMRRFEAEHSQEDVDLAFDTWEQIAIQLQRAKEDSQRMLKHRNRKPEELETLVEEMQLDACEPKTGRTNRFLKKLKASYEVPLQAGSKVVAQGKWAIYKKTQLDGLLKSIRKHVTALELILPEQESKLVAAEAAAMTDEVHQVLKPLADESDPLLATAMVGDGPRRGFIYENIHMTEKARAHHGSNYDGVPTQEGLTVWRDVHLGGETFQHAGHNYTNNATTRYCS